MIHYYCDGLAHGTVEFREGQSKFLIVRWVRYVSLRSLLTKMIRDNKDDTMRNDKNDTIRNDSNDTIRDSDIQEIRIRRE